MSETAPGSYPLLEKPWIKVLDLNGTECTLSLHETLARAHELERIAGELPSQDFAVLRILLAILYRALDARESPQPREDWGELWRAGQLPMERIGEYLEKWRDRFDLLHPETPFLQVPDLRTQKGEWKTLDLLVADSDDSGALFTMRSKLGSLPLGEAARWLVHAHAYDYSGIKSGAVGDTRVKGGRGYPLGIGWCGWLGGTWLEGRTLRETLLLNLVLERERRSVQDLPVWEQPPFTAAPREPGQAGPFGPVSLLCWPQRRIRLRVEGDRVTGVLITNGDPLDHANQHTHELMTGWRFSEPQTRKAKEVRYMPQALAPERALWRGLASVLPNENPELVRHKNGKSPKFLPAGVLEWLNNLLTAEELPEDYLVGVRVVSMIYGSQMSSFSDIAEDRLDFVALLARKNHQELRNAAFDAAKRAEDTAWALRVLANDLAIAAGGEAGGEGKRMSERVYAVLDRDYPAWLRELRDPKAAEAALSAWTGQLQDLANRLARQLIDTAPPAAWIGRPHNGGHVNVATAERRFRSRLRKALHATAASERDEPEADADDTTADEMERSDA